MKILIDEIPDKGTEIKLRSEVNEFDFLDEGLILKEPVSIKVNVDKAGSKVIIKGVIQTLVQLECSRCLEEFFYHIDEPFSATFFPVEDRPNDVDVALDSKDLDISYYSGQEIDLTGLVREQILLAIPMNPLCKVTCRGLCPECGKNLNEGRCYCSASRSDIRWSKLKNFKDRENKDSND